jgi:hypothetical protein
MKKRPTNRMPPPPQGLRNLNHRPPVTRREFLGRGLLGASASVIGTSSLLGMMASPRRAYAALDPDIQALVSSPCNIQAGAGKIPFIVIDLAGGGNIAGSNALVGGKGGQLDFLTTSGYNKLGLPGNMIPNASAGAGNFVDTSIGIAMHSDSAYLRGIKARASASTLANINGAIIPSISQTDTNLNQQNPLYGIHAAGAAGDLLVLVGTEATASGGNSMAPSYMVDATVNPTVVTKPSDVTGLINTGSLVGLLNQADAVHVLESTARLSVAKMGTVSTGLASADDTKAKNLVECSYVDAAYLVDKYGNALQALDPTLDPHITGSGGIFTSTDLQNRDFLATASVMKMVINGYAGGGTIELGGFDYHDSTRSTGESRDFEAGQVMGACLEYAARVGVPLMICVITDGSLVSSGMPDNSVGGRGKGAWMADNTATGAALMLVYDPRSKPSTIMNQIGYFNPDGTINATGSPAANSVTLLAETMVLNYMALHGSAGAFQALTYANGQPSGLGAAASYDSQIAFGQLASVSNGKIIPPA